MQLELHKPIKLTGKRSYNIPEVSKRQETNVKDLNMKDLNVKGASHTIGIKTQASVVAKKGKKANLLGATVLQENAAR